MWQDILRELPNAGGRENITNSLERGVGLAPGQTGAEEVCGGLKTGEPRNSQRTCTEQPTRPNSEPQVEQGGVRWSRTADMEGAHCRVKAGTLEPMNSQTWPAKAPLLYRDGQWEGTSGKVIKMKQN